MLEGEEGVAAQRGYGDGGEEGVASDAATGRGYSIIDDGALEGWARSGVATGGRGLILGGNRLAVWVLMEICCQSFRRGLLWAAGWAVAGAAFLAAAEGAERRVSADDPEVAYSGRMARTGDSSVALGYSGARVRLRFEGESVALLMDDPAGANYAQAWIDGEVSGKFRLDRADGRYVLAEGLGAGEHTVEVTRVTEGFLGLTTFRGFEIGGAGKALPWVGQLDRRIEFIGDSITCGYGVEVDDPSLQFEAGTENFCLGYSGLAARALGADYLVVSRSGIGMVRGYDGPYEGSEETMPGIYEQTFYGQPGAKWDFGRFAPDVVCINLGTNDFSTTGVNVERFVSAYIGFATRIVERHPSAKLVLLQGPMENGEALAAALARVEIAVSEKAPGRVHSFKLSPQGELGFGADYHPNRAQSKRNAEELRAFLSELMDWR